tara:strand:+ start:687 stop:1049 length:363 start_codon:yes stop_codon:yes gene_type:complete
VLKATDQSPWVIIRTLKAATPGKTIGAPCRRIPVPPELHQSQQGEFELSGKGNGCRDNSGETTVRARLGKHQNRNPPGSKRFHPAALATFINANITAQPQQGQPAGIADLSREFTQQWMR